MGKLILGSTTKNMPMGSLNFVEKEKLKNLYIVRNADLTKAKLIKKIYYQDASNSLYKIVENK